MKALSCSRCPTCGNRAFEAVRPAQFVAFRSDRLCTACDTRYSPPTPAWAALLFIVLGLVVVAACSGSIVIAIVLGSMFALPLNAGLAVLGVLCLRQGVRSLREEIADAPVPTGPEPATLLQSLKEHQGVCVAGLGTVAVLGAVILWCVTLIRQQQLKVESLREQQRRAVRALEQLGGSVNGIGPWGPTEIVLQRSDPYTRSFLGQNVGLRELVDDDVKVVAGFPRLEGLIIRSTEITDAGLRQLPPQPELTRFIVECPLVTEAGLEVISDMDRLRFLTLAGTRVSHLSTFALDRKPQLTDLNLSKTPFASDAVTELKSVPSLQRLDLSETNVDDRCLPVLAQLSNLEELRLDETQVTDDGIHALQSMSRLRLLTVADTKVSEAGRDAIQQHLPDCKIVLTWRVWGPGMPLVPAE